MAKAASKPKDLVDEIGDCYADPARFVLLAFDWGYGMLKDEQGPDKWQIEVMNDIAKSVLDYEKTRVRNPSFMDANGTPIQSWTQVAVSSGNRIGKSALVAWLILWFMSTRRHPQLVVMANSLPQLSGKTWRELAKWHKLAINADWFKWTATKFYKVEHPETWFAQATAWSEDHPEATSGTHDEHVMVIMDEAAGIPDIIWDYQDQTMTDPGVIRCVFGNPTRNTGRFAECFGRFKHRWITRQIDSRSCKKADKAAIKAWIDDYGEDSDYVRVRVKGVFPRSGDRQFIGSDVVDKCMKYEAKGYEGMPKLFGVDVARYGDDQSVILCRQGRKVLWIKKYREMDLAKMSSLIVEAANEEKPDAIFIDSVGLGAGVVDMVRKLGVDCIEVNAGSTDCHPKYRNKRAEMWAEMRQWLKLGAELPDDKELAADLTGPEYDFTNTQRLMLERKIDMKKRGLSSPDCGDSLALTFAYPVGASFESGEQYEPEVFMDGV